MSGMKRRLCCAGSAGVVVAALCLVAMPVLAQNSAAQGEKPPTQRIAGGFDKVAILPPGGPAPRSSDGHPQYH